MRRRVIIRKRSILERRNRCANEPMNLVIWAFPFYHALLCFARLETKLCWLTLLLLSSSPLIFLLIFFPIRAYVAKRVHGSYDDTRRVCPGFACYWNTFSQLFLVHRTKSPKFYAKCAEIKPAVSITASLRATDAEDSSKEASGDWLPCKEFNTHVQSGALTFLVYIETSSDQV